MTFTPTVETTLAKLSEGNGKLFASDEVQALVDQLESVERAVEKGRWAYEMLRHHRGNEKATLAWAETFLREGADIFARAALACPPQQPELDELCAACRGQGDTHGQRCPRCGGTGFKSRPACPPPEEEK